jgi:hypothetical protein
MNEPHALARSAQKASLLSPFRKAGTAPAEVRIAVIGEIFNPLTGNCGPSRRPVRPTARQCVATLDVTRTILLSQLSCRAYAKD